MTSSPPGATTDASETAKVRAGLIKKFGGEGELMSLGVAIARVVELTSSDGEAAESLAFYVLADVALTQKILRLANTVTYRTAAATPITTVSRAIFVLGFDIVKTAALALLLVENLSNSAHAEAIRKQLIESLCASLLGREMARSTSMQGAEEASIAALFNNLSRMLLASHEHALYQRITERVAAGASQAQAAIQVMGCTYDFLTETVLREWNFPEFLVQAQERLPPGVIRAAKTRQEWMRQVVSFCADAAPLVVQSVESITSAQIQPLLTRYGAALHVDMDRLRLLFELVGRNITDVVTSLNLAGPSAPVVTEKPSTLPSVLKLAMMASHTVVSDECYDSGKPIGARDRLLDGVQVATQMIGAGARKPGALIMLIVETLHSSLGFRFATVCIRNTRANNFRAVVSIGEQHAQRQAGFNFPATPAGDIFHLAMENNANLMIEDSSMGSVRDLIPDWHKQLLPDARSMMILPLVRDGNAVGVFYADRVQPAPEGVTSDETALIKTLIGQMMTAINLP